MSNVRTPKARLMFPKLFKAESFNGGAPKFSALLVFDKKAQATPEFKNLVTAIKEAAKEEFGDQIPKKFHWPLKKSDELTNANGEIYDGVEEGDVGIRVSSGEDYPPEIINEKKEPALPKEIYAGCYVLASVFPKAFDMTGNKGVTLYLNVAMKLADGKRLGGRKSASEEFEDIVVESADADLDDIGF